MDRFRPRQTNLRRGPPTRGVVAAHVTFLPCAGRGRPCREQGPRTLSAGETREEMARQEGTLISWFSERGYGFVKDVWGDDIFVHNTRLQDARARTAALLASGRPPSSVLACLEAPFFTF